MFDREIEVIYKDRRFRIGEEPVKGVMFMPMFSTVEDSTLLGVYVIDNGNLTYLKNDGINVIEVFCDD